MKNIKKILSLTILIFILVLLGFNSVEATTLVPLKRVDGSNLKYRGTNTDVLIPKEYVTPDSEFRAVWVTPITGEISYRSQYTFKSQVDFILDKMEEFNLNALFFHVRPYNDALYASQLNPRSHYFGTYGVDPGWDPLPYVIEEAHKRGIEFHAWLNPYRIRKQSGYSTPEQYANYIKAPNIGTDPDNILVNSDGNAILNPGEPAVRDFLIDTVMELIENYDIDGVHFDDYFYIKGIDDSHTRSKLGYNPNNLGVDNWRREQVNIFIEDLSREMRAYNLANNRYVQLGISPTGIYKNGSYGVPEGGPDDYDSNGNFITNGSNTAGQEHYASYLYADSKKWVDNEWIDYILPQTYWAFEHTVAGYADVVDWWAKVVRYKNVNFYTGMGSYMGNQDSGNFSWTSNPYEAPNQVKYNTKHESIKGVSIYNYNSLLSSQSHLQTGFNEIKTKMWNSKVLRPEIRTFNSSPLNSVSNVSIFNDGNQTTISWDHIPDARTYAVYRFTDNVDFNDTSKIVDILGFSSDAERITFTDNEVSSNYTYGIRAINGANTLGEPYLVTEEDSVIQITLKDNINNTLLLSNKLEGVYGEKTIITSNNNNNNYRYFFLENNNKIITTESSYEVTFTKSETYKGYFVGKDKIGVAFVYPNNDLISFQTVSHVSEIVYPTNLADYNGYTFSHWSRTKDQITEDTIIKAVYKSKLTDSIDITIDDGTGVQNKTLKFGDRIKLNSNLTNFSHWEVNGQVYSYQQTDYISVYNKLDIKAISSTNTISPNVWINPDIIDLDGKYAFLGKFVLPNQGSLIEVGILLIEDNITNLTFDTPNVFQARALKLSSSNEFSFIKETINYNSFYSVRFYLNYLDGEDIKTTYSNTLNFSTFSSDYTELEGIVGLIPKHINSDYHFPSQDGLSFTYADGEDSSLFDLNTGTHLVKRVTVQKRTIVATLNNASITFEVNFGVLGEEEVGSYYYGNPGSASKLEPDYSGTFIGWSGYTLTKGNDVLFVGQTIELEGSGLITDSNILKPSTPFTSIGTLYVNTGSNDVSFKIGDIRVQNSNVYVKVLIGSNGEVKQFISTQVSDDLEITLKPGEAFWSPQYNDKQFGLSWGGPNDFTGVSVIKVKKYN